MSQSSKIPTLNGSAIQNFNHRLRTPLSCIVGLLDTFDKNNLTTQQAEWLHDLKHCSQTLLTEIEQVLTVLEKPKVLN